MARNLTTAQLASEGLGRLAPALETAHLDAELLLAHVLGVPRARIKSHPEEVRSADERERYLALLERRARGEPLAYLVGHKGFWSLELQVGPQVLVPRPETELLVERALALRAHPTGAAADLGTGSGAIALALALERPGWRITATDRSLEALGVARRNLERLQLANVELLAGDWFGPLAQRRFDLLLSNPPYVASDDPALAAAPLAWEPRAALTPGPDSMAALHRIIHEAPGHLAPGGWLVLEHAPMQADAVARELVARGFSRVRSHLDLAGHVRASEARWGVEDGE